MNARAPIPDRDDYETVVDAFNIFGAHCYVVIATAAGHHHDVRIGGGRGAARGLRDYAEEQQKAAARSARKARLAMAAAAFIEERSRK